MSSGVSYSPLGKGKICRLYTSRSICSGSHIDCTPLPQLSAHHSTWTLQILWITLLHRRRTFPSNESLVLTGRISHTAALDPYSSKFRNICLTRNICCVAHEAMEVEIISDSCIHEESCFFC